MALNWKEDIKGMSREERKQYFLDNKNELLSASELDAVNGGVASNGENTNSDIVPYYGRWYSSYGFICHGQEWC